MADITIQDRLQGLVDSQAQEIDDDVDRFIEDEMEYILEIQSIKSGDTLTGVILVTGTGGPHIEVNTRDKTVYGFWGSNQAEAMIYSESANTINDFFEQMDM